MQIHKSFLLTTVVLLLISSKQGLTVEEDKSHLIQNTH